jgi:hypothetical protein
MSTLIHSETRLRRFFGWALGATLLGVTASVYHGPGLGAWLGVAGLLGLVLCVHRIGRLGPDPPFRVGKLRTRHKKSRSA